ncbi:MAG: hypothetical protein U0795_01215 [Pirellulales bacterium]
MTDWQNWATGLSVVAAAGYLIWRVRTFCRATGQATGQATGGCGHCPQRPSAEPDRQLKVLPLVSLDVQPPRRASN